jgi:hypothetical protein
MVFVEYYVERNEQLIAGVFIVLPVFSCVSKAF